jgi:hypothetical protein
MSTILARLVLGFFAGAFSHVIFQNLVIAILYPAKLFPAPPWNWASVPPFGVPQTLNLAFWAGLWGVAYALLEPWLTGRLGWLAGGLVYGLAPLLGFWLIVLPIKGAGIGGGFDPAAVPVHIALHAAYGVGVAILFRLGLPLVERASTI